MDLKLNQEEYFDVELANSEDDYDTTIINSTEIIRNGLAIYIDINQQNSFSGLSINGNPTKITSLSAWTSASVDIFDLNDVGITGIDNGRFSSLTGQSQTFTSADTKLSLYSISGKTGSTSSYDISTGSTGSIGTYLNFSGGGYFQGVYRIAGYPQYNIFPNRTELGYTAEFWLKYSGQSGSNSNFFFYMGTRAENKFWNIFSGETGLTTTSGISISPSVSANTFLDTADNVMGFRFSGDTIGVRWLSGSTDCSGSITGVTVQQSYSKHGIFDNFSGATNNDWINVAIRFKRDRLIDQCTINSGTTPFNGTLTFYLNARPVYEIKNFKELIFRGLNTHKTKQQLVGFNISVGGGSFGLRESQTFLGPDNADSGLTISNNFNGNLNGGLSQFRFYVVPLSVDKLIHNFEIEKSRYNRSENFGSRLIKINRGINV